MVSNFGRINFRLYRRLALVFSLILLLSLHNCQMIILYWLNWDIYFVIMILMLSCFKGLLFFSLIAINLVILLWLVLLFFFVNGFYFWIFLGLLCFVRKILLVDFRSFILVGYDLFILSHLFLLFCCYCSFHKILYYLMELHNFVMY